MRECPVAVVPLRRELSQKLERARNDIHLPLEAVVVRGLDLIEPPKDLVLGRLVGEQAGEPGTTTTSDKKEKVLNS